MNQERPLRARTFNQQEIVPTPGDVTQCAGKEKLSRAAANRVCRETRKVRLDAFRCQVCDYWHVGVPRSGQRVARRKRPLREFGGEQ